MPKEAVKLVALGAGAVVGVSGLTCWSSDDSATSTRVPRLGNGIYDRTGELSGGLPIYFRRDSVSNDLVHK